MGLPTSGQLSLNDIRAELGAATTNVSLGSMSDSVGFIAPDKVSDFYGYTSTTTFYATLAVGKTAFGCNITINQTRYHNGSSLLPVVGDTVYTNSTGTTVDASVIRGMSTANSGTSFQVYVTNASGVVGTVYICPL